jgi:hypothetical protein
VVAETTLVGPRQHPRSLPGTGAERSGTARRATWCLFVGLLSAAGLMTILVAARRRERR